MMMVKTSIIVLKGSQVVKSCYNDVRIIKTIYFELVNATQNNY